MSISECWSNINNSIIAIGTLLIGIGAIRALPKIAKSATAKLSNELLYGNEAKIRFEEIEPNLHNNDPYVWGPCEWGGEIIPSNCMLEIRAHFYSPNTDGIEWKDKNKSIRYVYRNKEGNLEVKGWGIK